MTTRFSPSAGTIRRRMAAAAGLATLLLAAPISASAAPTVPEQMKAAQYLVGTWTCAHTVGDFAGTYTTSFASTLDGRWLKQSYAFPATTTDPAWRGEAFLGFDGRAGRGRWVRFFATSLGDYWGMTSTPASDSVWPWEYVLPGASRPGLMTWTKRSDSEFTQDGPEYTLNGKLVTEHHVCKKS